MILNTIDFNARPLTNQALPLVWSLHCGQGELYDFIVMSEAHRLEYSTWRETQKTEAVIECNYNYEYGTKESLEVKKMLFLVNSLK